MVFMHCDVFDLIVVFLVEVQRSQILTLVKMGYISTFSIFTWSCFEMLFLSGYKQELATKNSMIDP